MFALCDWLSAHGTSCAELVGFIAGVLNVWLVTRENIWSWPVGIINAAFYIVVFARAGLYSDTGLQGVYLLLSIYGWWQWHRGAAARQHGAARTPLVVTNVRPSLVLPLLGIAVALWLGLAAITSRIPNSTLPWFDAALVASSLVAQWMMTKKLRECWWVWIVVDAAYVGLFIMRGLHLTAVLYFIFFLLAILGLVQWTRSAQRSTPLHSPASS
jgi:nicotinamide mononucleotide transporter